MPETIVPSTEQLRGLSHPVRVKLLGLLRMDGPQTSAELARATGLNTGATSYHLRQLAEHGFVEDAPGLGTGRERHWRARHRRTDPNGPAGRPAAATSLDDQAAWQQTVVTWTAGVIQAAHDEWTELPEAWRAATMFNDYLLRCNAAQASEVLSRLTAILDEVSAQFDADPAAGRGAGDTELWSVHLLAFPVPGRIPHREEQ